MPRYRLRTLLILLTPMSFLRTSRENWSRYCNEHASLVNQLSSLPIAFSNPDRFDDFLQRGETSSKDATERLSDLSDDDWQVFEQFMKHFKAGWQTYFVETLYPAYFREVARRTNP